MGFSAWAEEGSRFYTQVCSEVSVGSCKVCLKVVLQAEQ